MKTTVEIDDDLLERAKQALSTGTIKQTVERSLEAVVRRKALEHLAAAAGKMDLDLTAAGLRLQRRKRLGRVPR
ncbi:MAG: type II toxin-antitoxin system VapB family antitoxin [Planctomycetes bacterium]|nr:type II toxin-antitoxin system VapB family antitoxin [Planctomycetota bacterium]